jgi:hypothetical protein
MFTSAPLRRTTARKHIRRLSQLLLTGLLCCLMNSAVAAPVGATWINPMNFGRFAIGPSGGTLSMDVSTGLRTGSGSVVPLPGGSITQMRLDVSGDPGVSVTITLPTSVAITGSSFGSVLSWTPMLDTPLIFNMPAGGTKIINIAGDLAIPANSIADTFTGDVSILIEYTF